MRLRPFKLLLLELKLRKNSRVFKSCVDHKKEDLQIFWNSHYLMIDNYLVVQKICEKNLFQTFFIQ